MFKVDIEPQKFNIKFFGFVFIKYSYKRGYSGKCHFFVFFGCITPELSRPARRATRHNETAKRARLERVVSAAEGVAMNVLEEIARKLDEGSPHILYRQELAEILRSVISCAGHSCGDMRRDAERYRWLCDGNGYFMEERGLCGHWNEKEEADKEIDAAMRGQGANA